jgi:hypothetical protein
MPLFYLHIRRDAVLLEDPGGSDLPDVATAREQALGAVRDLWASAIIEGEDLSGQMFVIADEHGEQFVLVPFIDALPQGLRERLVHH